MELSNGAVYSSVNQAFSTFDTNALLKGIIVKVNYPDDADSDSEFGITYDVELLEQFANGLVITGVEPINSIGGPFNFNQVILQPAEKNVDGEQLKMSEHIGLVGVGDTVIIGFKGNDSSRPILIGATPSFLSPEPPKKEDGLKILGEYNGLRWNINKDGELIVTYLGGQRQIPAIKDESVEDEEKTFNPTERPTTAPTTIKIDKNGSFSIEDKENQKLSIDRTTKQISISQYSKAKDDEGAKKEENGEPKLATQILLDKDKQLITIKTRDPENDEDLVAQTIDGMNQKMEITTKNSTKLHIDGKNDEILLKDKAAGTLKISNGKVGLGTASVEVITKLIEILEKLSESHVEMQGETHIGNLGYPTGTPVNASSYASIKSQLDAIKSALNGIKGGV